MFFQFADVEDNMLGFGATFWLCLATTIYMTAWCQALKGMRNYFWPATAPSAMWRTRAYDPRANKVGPCSGILIF